MQLMHQIKIISVFQSYTFNESLFHSRLEFLLGLLHFINDMQEAPA